MSASLRTRDGSFSVAGAILAGEQAAARHAQIDMDGALAWARNNGVSLKRVKHPVPYINSKRTKLGLPPFEVPSIGKDLGTVSELAESNGPKLRPTPLVSSQDELKARVQNFNGMLAGLVTPEIAGWLLEMNTGNRPLNPDAVERFRDILRNGQWMNTGEAIIVASNGTLNDGQHRLIAIQTSGIPAVIDVRCWHRPRSF